MFCLPLFYRALQRSIDSLRAVLVSQQLGWCKSAECPHWHTRAAWHNQVISQNLAIWVHRVFALLQIHRDQNSRTTTNQLLVWESQGMFFYWLQFTALPPLCSLRKWQKIRVLSDKQPLQSDLILFSQKMVVMRCILCRAGVRADAPTDHKRHEFLVTRPKEEVK